MSPWRKLAVYVVGLAIAGAGTMSELAAQSHHAQIVGELWLGPHPRDPRQDLDRRFWQGPGAMVAEQQHAYRVIRSWWPSPLHDARAAAMIEGFAWYLQTHAIEREFDARYLRTAHSVESKAYLGDHIIWSFPSLRLSRHAAARRDGYAKVFAALERWIGGAALQGAMFELARVQDPQLSANTIIKTISEAAGQDLTWVFIAAEPEAELNYKVAAMTSGAGSNCPAPCVQSVITVEREGDGIFPGRSGLRVGDFESGDALLLDVEFEDGTRASARWDGRDDSRQFTFIGSSRAVVARLDPDRLVTLDTNRLDNAIVEPAPTNVPVHKWAARWMVWLQHTMLSYGFLA